MAMLKKKEIDKKYQYGFNDGKISVFQTKKGLNEEVVRAISAKKNEPEWMLKIRLEAYAKFITMPQPTWGADLSFVDFQDYTYYVRATEKQQTD